MLVKSDLNADNNTNNQIVRNALQLLTLAYTYTSEEETPLTEIPFAWVSHNL